MVIQEDRAPTSLQVLLAPLALQVVIRDPLPDTHQGLHRQDSHNQLLLDIQQPQVHLNTVLQPLQDRDFRDSQQDRNKVILDNRLDHKVIRDNLQDPNQVSQGNRQDLNKVTQDNQLDHNKGILGNLPDLRLVIHLEDHKDQDFQHQVVPHQHQVNIFRNNYK